MIKYKYISKKIKIIVPVFLFFGLFCVLYILRGYPLVIKKNSIELIPQKGIGHLEEFNPFERYDFSTGNWTAYLIVDKSDFKALNAILDPYKVYKCGSVETFKQMQMDWMFRHSGGDMATVTSLIVIEKDGVVVFQSGIVIEENVVGLQSPQYGWIEPKYPDKFIRTLEGFKKVFSPIVFI